MEITGPDAARFVALITPRDVRRWQVGQCHYLLVTADDGGIVNGPGGLRLGENHFWLSTADSDLWLYAHRVNAMANLDVRIADPNAVVLRGPRSLDLMADLVGGIPGLRYYRFSEHTIAGAPCVVSPSTGCPLSLSTPSSTPSARASGCSSSLTARSCPSPRWLRGTHHADRRDL